MEDKSLEKHDPLAELKKHVDGFILIAYRKDNHEKIAMKYAADQACADGLSFLDAHVGQWKELGTNTPGLSTNEQEDEQ